MKLSLLRIGATVILASLLTGCTDEIMGLLFEPIPQPEPVITEAPITSTPTPEQAIEPEPTETAEEDFECLPPTPEVMEYLRNFTMPLRPATWTSSDVVQILVGEGNNPGEEWWIVAVHDYNRDSGRREDRVFLTNEPSPFKPSGSTWISVSHHLNRPREEGWGFVRWPEDRIAQGRRAQAAALSCLE